MKESSLMKVFDGDKLVGLIDTADTATKRPLDSFEKEVLRIFNEYQELQAENKRLKEEYKDYERLYELADGIDCKCDIGPPWNKCPQCKAAHALNECGEIIGEAIREIEQALQGDQ